MMYATIWSIGGALEESSRRGFSDFLQKVSSGIDVCKVYQLETDEP
jgi:hypothetical protein